MGKTAKEATRINEILFQLTTAASGRKSGIGVFGSSSADAQALEARLKALYPEISKIKTSKEFRAFAEANKDLLKQLSVENDDFGGFFSTRDRFRSVFDETLEAIENETEKTGDLKEAQDELNFAKQKGAEDNKENAAENLKLLDAQKAKLAELDKQIKAASKDQKGALQNQRQAVLDNIEDLEKALGILKAPPVRTATAAAARGTKKKTASEAQNELIDEFNAELRKSLIRDEVKDFIAASQAIEEDRKKRLEKIEKLEKEFGKKFGDARKISDQIVNNDLLRDRQAYETGRLKLIADNEARISQLQADAELKRAQVIKNSFAIETDLLKRELQKQQDDVTRDRDAAVRKLKEDAQKGLFGNLERAADGVNLPRDADGSIIIRFVKVDENGTPLKNADGTFQEDLEALEKFNQQVEAANKLAATTSETNTALHNDKLLDLQLKYYAESQATLAAFLDQQNLNLTEGFTEQIQAQTDAYLQGKISLKEYTDFVEAQNKRLAKDTLQAQLDAAAGKDFNGRSFLKNQSPASSISGGRIGDINKILTDGGFTNQDKNGNTVFTPLDDQARNKLLKERRDLEQEILAILLKQNEAAAGDKTDADKKKVENLTKVVEAYQEISGAAVSAAQTIIDSLQKQTDAEIAIREKRVDRAKEIADRGNAEMLEAEEERLNELQEKQARFARIQLGLNALITTSNTIAAVAKAAAEGGIFAPATIALVIAAIASGFATVKSFTADLPGFAEGVVDYKGKGTGTSDSNLIRFSNRESVMTAKATANHKGVLEAMNRGEVFDVANVNGVQMLVNRDNYSVKGAPGSKDRPEKLAGKLDEVKEAIENQEGASLTIDRRGIVAIVQKVLGDERKRWKN